MSPDLTILIPSKGRAATATTPALLRAAGLPFAFVVEPQEAATYAPLGPVVVLPLNDQGIAYVRNFVLSYAREQALPWVLMLDDDIKYFGRVVAQRVQRTDAGELLRAFALIKRLNPAVGGLEYRQTAWSATKEITANRFCDVAVFLNIAKINWQYRPEMNLKEDRDFVLQAIRAGAGVVRVNKYCFEVPAVASNAGGLQEAYRAKRDNQALQNMVRAWPGVLGVVQKKDRLDLKVNWKALGV